MRFSILIPAYKLHYLKTCIDSVIAQSFGDFEVIILNDNSPEDIESIIKSYSDNRIKYFKNSSNVGAEEVVDNWNKCLSESKGDYVLCMGDDDCLASNCLEVYNQLINKYPQSHVYHAWTCIIDEDGKAIKMQEKRPEVESKYSALYGRWFNRRMQYIGDWLFQRESLKANGGFYKLPYAWGSDDITAIMCAMDQPIINSQIPLFFYRENQQTISNSGNNKGKAVALNLQKQWFEVFFDNVGNIIDRPSQLFLHYSMAHLSEYFNNEFVVCIREDLIENRKLSDLAYWLRTSSAIEVGRLKIVFLYLKTIIKHVLCIKR